MTRRLTRHGTRLGRFQNACPDCSAYADLIAYSDLLTIVEVFHDETCPSHHARTARRNERKNR